MNSDILMVRRFGAFARSQFLTTAGATALLAAFSAGAHAQQTAAADQTETVVVSASRITASGFSAPTPTTVLGVADIQQNAAPNVFDTITQLPSLQGSTGSQVNNGNTSTGANGLSQFNLRGLGTIRTLTLIDGQRVVPAYVSGTADVSEMPQLLIQRVDVVTGGASASWGSDAVGGVVNFVTDKKFNGVKGNIQAGQSTYGDDTNALFQMAAGSEIFGGKGHIEAASEFYHNDGIPAPMIIGGALAAGRCCNYGSATQSYNLNATPKGVPQFNPILNSQSTTASEYGLITAVPTTTSPAVLGLKGLAFDANGNLTPFQFGTSCIGTTCIGGDRTNTTQKVSPDAALTRGVFYTRLSYNIAPQIEVYGTFNFGNVLAHTSPGTGNNTGFTVTCNSNVAGGANYYLPASIVNTCTANKINSFTMGVSYDKFPAIRINSARQQRRYVLGADGVFGMFGSDWSFDAYYQHGENDTSIRIHDILMRARYNAAADAIAGPNGTVVCRSTVAQANGCTPFNVFGGAPLSYAAMQYVDPHANGPVSLTEERQEAASIAINGTPFKDWAGDVALAFGAEYREEAYATSGDPYGNGVAPESPYSAQYPFDPVLATTDNWLAGNYHNGSGNYHVYEAFVEAGIPLIDDTQWGKADFNIAGRGTNYSTSGFVDAWKLGLTWDTPLDGIRFRALQSRDVRAPNLSELFAAPITMNNGVTDRTLPATAPNVTIINNAVGNPNLKPETAQTTEIGFVYQPSYLPGLNFSVDYYRVGIKKQIGSLTNQQIVDLCQLQGNTSYCQYIFLKGTPGTSTPSYVIVPPFNLANTVTDGFDFEASYQFDLQDWNVPGRFVIRGLADHVSKFIADTGVAGQPIAEYAGAGGNANGTTGFGGGVPLWKALFTQSWNADPISFNVTERYFSAGVVNPYGIVCQAPNCPAPTAQHPTYSSMDLPSYFYVDIGGSYQIGNGLQAYFKVNNIADQLPKPVAGLNSDPVGRVYRVGLRFSN